MPKKIKNQQVASWLIKIGLAVVFLYAAISSIQHPLEWVGFLPALLTKAMSPTVLIKLFAIYELALAGWLLIGKYAQYAGLLCAATLIGIVIVNPSQLIATFRDIGLACMALALFFLEK